MMGRREVEFDVPVSPTAPREARNRATRCLHDWGFVEPGWLEVAAVLVSELVTNVVQHTRVSSLRIGLHADAGSVRLSVADGSGDLPLARPPDSLGGRGLLLIEALSKGWTVLPHARGKRIEVTLQPYAGLPGPASA
jgi:anti-sigma regulatory factor (Ser/Thr protein kinase)